MSRRFAGGTCVDICLSLSQRSRHIRKGEMSVSFTTNWGRPVPPAAEVRAAYRPAIAKGMMDSIRIRVSERGMGGEGILAGYSTRPLVVTTGTIKPKKTPVRGWNAFHEGGYKQYRKELGLQSDLFVFSNKGAAWRDWKFF